MPRSLAEWLEWQESLNPAEIDLRLDRVSQVAASLPIAPPPGAVFVVAGTNGKGSCSAFLGSLLARGGFLTGIYSSPHLVRYNERIVVAGQPAEDAELIVGLRADRGRARCHRADFLRIWNPCGLADLYAARNARPGCSKSVSVAGSMRSMPSTTITASLRRLISIIRHGSEIRSRRLPPKRPGLCGPAGLRSTAIARCRASLRGYAAEIGARLLCLGEDYACVRKASCWDWHGQALRLADLPFPVGQGDEQLRNMSAAFAALERFDTGFTERFRCSARGSGEFQIAGPLSAPSGRTRVDHRCGAQSAVGGRANQ